MTQVGAQQVLRAVSVTPQPPPATVTPQIGPAAAADRLSLPADLIWV